MIQLLDVVALTEDLPDKGLVRGQVGTVVGPLDPQVFEVEQSWTNLRRAGTASRSVDGPTSSTT